MRLTKLSIFIEFYKLDEEPDQSRRIYALTEYQQEITVG